MTVTVDVWFSAILFNYRVNCHSGSHGVTRFLSGVPIVVASWLGVPLQSGVFGQRTCFVAGGCASVHLLECTQMTSVTEGEV